MSYTQAELFVTYMLDYLWKTQNKQYLLSLQFGATLYRENEEQTLQAQDRWLYILADGTSNYRSIWTHVADKPVFDFEKVAWEHQSSHDSCWRTDGMRMISELWFKTRDELLAKLGSEPAPMGSKIRYQVNDAVRVWPSSNIHAVLFRKERDPADRYTYTVHGLRVI